MIKGTEQQIKVLKSYAPVKRVIACAGSGKTWVLTRSIVNAINDGNCRPDEILALTFTVNAAENMRSRIRELLGDSNLDLDIYTFNSFGNEVIYQNSFELGLGKDFKLITGSQSWRILYEVFRHINLTKVKIGKNPGIFLQKLLTFIEDVKNNLISVTDLESYLTNQEAILSEYKSRALRDEENDIAETAEELFEVYKKYEELKWEKNMIDYPDQVYLPYMLLSQSKVLREKYSQKYKYILIDEFQDTNVAQARFLTLLYKKDYNNMMIVGDDDQGIYSFRGACVNNILDFDRWECFRDDTVKNYYLSVNFRSGPGIIEPIRSVISKNKKRFDKTITSYNDKKESSIFFNVDRTLDEEAKSVALFIKNMIRSKNIKPGKIAIISRRKRFEKIAEALKKEDIAYELIGSKNFYYEPEILFLISWLKVISDIKDELSMIYLLKSDKYRIGDRDIFFLKKGGINGKKSDLVDGIRDSGNNDFLSSQTKKRLKSFLDSLLFYIKKSGMLDLKELISLIFEDSGLSCELKSGFGKSFKNRIRNVENLIKIAADFKSDSGEEGNESFIMYVRDIARTEYDDPDTLEITGSNSVKLMSIHAAKGLEFEAVVLPMLWKGDYLGRVNKGSGFVIPSSLRNDSPVWSRKRDYKSAAGFNDALKELKTEEERRIFYVACSRARSILLLSHSRYESAEDMDSGKKKPKEIVPFFMDLVRGNRNIIPLGKGAEGYLNDIEKDYPVYKKKEGDCLKAERKKHGRVSSSGKKYDWKKIENRLGDTVKVFSSADRQDVCKYFLKNFNISVDSNMFEKAGYGTLQTEGILKKKNYPVPSRNMFSLTPLLDYMDCPAMYRLRYVYSIPQKQDKKMMMGERIHKYIENISRIKHECSSLNPELITGGIEDDIKPYIETFLKSRLADISDKRPEKMHLERLFYFKAGSSFITGKLDRIDICRGNVEIVDYKMSGKKEGHLSYRYRNQLITYIAAVSDIMRIPVTGIKGTIFYLDSGEWDSIQGDEESIKANTNLISHTVNRIKKEEFDPVKKSDCIKKCQYRDLCD